MVERGIRPDMVTDQTSAHDPINGYLPPAGRWDGRNGASDPLKPCKAAKHRWPRT